MKNEKKLTLKTNGSDVAYLRLPNHPGEGVPNSVFKNVRLSDLLAYQGPDIYLDIDENGNLIGLEVLL